MANAQVTTNWQYNFQGPHGVVVHPTNANVGYFFYNDRTDGDLKYRKSTNLDAALPTWSAPVVVHAGANAVSCYTWPDWHTPGDSGTKIHIVCIDDGVDDVFYRSLDISTDTLGTERTVFAGTTLTNSSISVTKTRGGNLLAAWNAGGTDRGAARSTDGGVTWSPITSPIEDTNDQCTLYPANLADPNDAWAIYFDFSATEYSLKTYDDSAGTWSEVALYSGVTFDFFIGSFSAAVRHSDGHLILAAFSTQVDQATNDFVIYDIANAGSITQKTNVITNMDDWGAPRIFIDQANGDLYAVHAGKSDGSETWASSMNFYYNKSTDGGATWGADTLLTDAANTSIVFLFIPPMGRRLIAVWAHDDFFFNYSVYTNSPASLDLTPVGTTPVSGTDAGSGSEVVTLAGALPTSDANATTTEATSLSTTRSSSDSGSGADSATGSTSASGSDSSSGADASTQKVSAPTTDTGSGADSSTQSASLPGTDAGAGSEGTPKIVQSVSDADGTVSEAGSVTVPVTGTDSGSGSDASTERAALPTSDSGSGADASVQTASHTVADAGSGTDSASLSRSVPVTDQNAGSGENAGISVPVVGVESGSGADASALASSIPGSDAGSSADAAQETASLTGADASAGSDTSSPSVALTSSDASGNAAESAQSSVLQAGNDSGSGAEGTNQVVSQSANDTSGAATENASPAATLPGSDSGSSLDNSALAASASGTDASGPSAESGSVSVPVSGQDTGSGNDNGGVSAQVTGTDSDGASSEGASASVLLPGTDLALALEGATLTVRLDASDSSGVATETAGPNLYGSDTYGTATESAVGSEASAVRDETPQATVTGGNPSSVIGDQSPQATVTGVASSATIAGQQGTVIYPDPDRPQAEIERA